MERDLPIHLRLAGHDQAPAVRKLAELDGVKPLSGEILVALRDGEPIAALSLADGRTAADPFRRTADAVAVLRTWATQVAAPAERAPRFKRRGLLRVA
jgi:hypothetical protein